MEECHLGTVFGFGDRRYVEYSISANMITITIWPWRVQCLSKIMSFGELVVS
jgi:hypothetical protein